MGWPTQKAVGKIVLCTLKRIDSSEICLDFVTFRGMQLWGIFQSNGKEPGKEKWELL